MKELQKSTVYRRFSFFGWNIYISRHALRKKGNQTRLRTSSKVRRLIATDNHCELCGRHININCTLWHMLPKGMSGRNDFKNVRVICPECHKFVQYLGAYRPMIERKGGTE